jgi:hypothetical protein
MLQAIVAHDHACVRAVGQKGVSRAPAVASYPNGRAGSAVNEQGLVPYFLHAGLGVDLQARLVVTSVAARHHAHLVALCLQVLYQANDRRRFSCASGHHIPNYDDKGIHALDWQPPPAKQLSTQCGQ